MSSMCSSAFQTSINTLRRRQNGRLFADDTFKRIFLNKNIRISVNISLKCVPRGPINNTPTLVQVMTWRRPGDKPLSEPVMVRLPTHICVTRPQWVNVCGEVLDLGDWCQIGYPFQTHLKVKYTKSFCLWPPSQLSNSFQWNFSSEHGNIVYMGAFIW